MTPLAPVSVNFIVEVFALKVKLVVVAKNHKVEAVFVHVHVPLPIVIVRTLELLELTAVAVTL